MNPEAALATLSSNPLIYPADAPKLVPGLYLLHDHELSPRYIGKTNNLRHRIWSNHCTGDENSHKWASAFNAGRLWHSPKNPLSDPQDGKIAKNLRALLARKYCMVRVLPLPGISDVELSYIEQAVRAIAPQTMNFWNDSKKVTPSEPKELVDELLFDLGWDKRKREALARQDAIWRCLET